MKCEGVQCRTTLWTIVFLGCGVNYMIRSNINIAIVAMVKQEDKNEDINLIQSECYSHNMSSPNINSTLENIEPSGTTFSWNEYEQSYVLGAFYWSYWLSQIAGGTLPLKYGSKRVFGFSNLFMCMSTYVIPLFAKWNIWALVTLRMLQGLIGGLCWPSLHVLGAKWIPPNERSKFMGAYTGSSFGAAITFPLCGFIIHQLGWEAVFYVTASIGVIWFCAWWFLIYDTPADHPRISDKELSHIQSSLGKTVSEKKLPTPWMQILLSGPGWLTIGVSWGCLWGMFTLLTQAPTYFQYVHGLGIRMTGFLSGIPHVCRMLTGISLAYICDTLLTKKIWTRTTVRKFAASVCCLLQGIFLLGLSFSGCNSIVAILCLTLALGTTGAESPGPLALYVDLSPNHASVLFGIANMVTVMPGFLSPVVVGLLTYQNQTANQWQIVFWVAAAMTFIPGILFLKFGTSDIQPWNYSGVTSEEEQHLKKKNSISQI